MGGQENLSGYERGLSGYERGYGRGISNTMPFVVLALVVGAVGGGIAGYRTGISNAKKDFDRTSLIVTVPENVQTTSAFNDQSFKKSWLRQEQTRAAQDFTKKEAEILQKEFDILKVSSMQPVKPGPG